MAQVQVARRSRRGGFTLVELLVVIAVIAILVALLIPAVQKVREAAARTQCFNNMKQMGLAMHAYHDRNKAFPTSGEGNWSAGGTGMDRQSFFTMILPFVEGGDIYGQYDLRFCYNDTTNAPVNKAVAQTVIPTYLCPSNPIRPASGRDSAGYGYTDYMPVSYCDIDPNTATIGVVVRNPNFRSPGGLQLGDPATANPKFANPGGNFVNGGGSNAGNITDGLSKTICMMEDVGRSETFFTIKYPDPIGVDCPVSGGTAFRAAWRWAEPDSGNGVSGPAGDSAGGPYPGGIGVKTGENFNMINNNALPFGGPATCPWAATNNCGVNDEPFSFHTGGCNTLFMDGHVTYLRETITPYALRTLCTPNEGLPPAISDY